MSHEFGSHGTESNLWAGVLPAIAPAAAYMLSNVNNTGFNYTFDGFAQTICLTSERLRDTANG